MSPEIRAELAMQRLVFKILTEQPRKQPGRKQREHLTMMGHRLVGDYLARCREATARLVARGGA